jgi:hypothetical protein
MTTRRFIGGGIVDTMVDECGSTMQQLAWLVKGGEDMANTSNQQWQIQNSKIPTLRVLMC